MTGTSKSPPICFEEKNGSPAFGAPAPLTKNFILFYFYFLLCIIIYIYIGKIKNSIQYQKKPVSTTKNQF